MSHSNLHRRGISHEYGTQLSNRVTAIDFLASPLHPGSNEVDQIFTLNCGGCGDAETANSSKSSTCSAERQSATIPSATTQSQAAAPSARLSAIAALLATRKAVQPAAKTMSESGCLTDSAQAVSLVMQAMRGLHRFSHPHIRISASSQQLSGAEKPAGVPSLCTGVRGQTPAEPNDKAKPASTSSVSRNGSKDTSCILSSFTSAPECAAPCAAEHTAQQTAQHTADRSAGAAERTTERTALAQVVQPQQSGASVPKRKSRGSTNAENRAVQGGVSKARRLLGKKTPRGAQALVTRPDDPPEPDSESLSVDMPQAADGRQIVNPNPSVPAENIEPHGAMAVHRVLAIMRKMHALPRAHVH
eukprot:CAMPEP_0119314510 /NCGR_PEP_ID=MMETSP1333-20130426/33011_1 /TAXON_ID=418940 /ORGANISM="Scyphosphaera apsteinii, Strain RCC1455" /LENGTH=359 /DNA_ID=CAMNT_0007319633 /DNA_START=23 /DNA_END=1102 /DNA_ORIENTATION=+